MPSPAIGTINADSSAKASGFGLLTASGIFSSPLNVLATMLGDSAAFRNWAGVNYAAQIYVGAVNAANLVRPYALLYLSPGVSLFPLTSGAFVAGEMILFFEADISPQYQADDEHVNAIYEFTNPIGQIMADVANMALSQDLLVIQEITMTQTPTRSYYDLTAGGIRDDFFQCQFLIRWGIH